MLVILHELDAFALQPRQTLLYVLLDAMQSRLGCVIVCGITRDHAVLELFEKRVKSRLQNHHVAFNRPTKVILYNSSRTAFDCVERIWVALPSD